MAKPFAVTIIDDGALPVGQDWALILDGGDTHFVIKRSKVCPRVVEEGQAALRSYKRCA